MNESDTSNGKELAMTGLKSIIQDKMKVREDSPKTRGGTTEGSPLTVKMAGTGGCNKVWRVMGTALFCG